MKKTTANRTDVYAEVTDRIIASIEAGARPWAKSWTDKGTNFCAQLRHNGQPYSGVNTLMLWTTAAERGYHANTWMTYKQAVELGGNVRKGEKGTLVVYANKFVKTEQNDAGEDVSKSIAFMKGYTVFNVEQIDGLPAKYYPQPAVARDPVELIAESEEFFARTGAVVRHGGDRAFYSPSADSIQLPQPEQFNSPEAYAAVKAHEVIHWTGAKSRCDRDLSGRFGDDSYAAEELIAEIGAAFLCSTLGVSAEPREDHASYVASWLKIMKGDKKAIFTAASAAQKAADYLYSLQQPLAMAA